MSHFYGTMQGSRGEATRCGTRTSGVNAHVRGRTIGGKVSVFQDENGNDTVRFTLTQGSKPLANGYLAGGDE